MEYGKLTQKDLEILTTIVGSERISTGESILELHGKDESFHEKKRPDVVIWPKNVEEISKILIFANKERIPVTPWGAGTSLEGNPIPVRGGIVLDMQQMNQIVEFCEGDLQVKVEAGITYKDLNQFLSRHGLFFPPDPGASATIGGMVGNNASGIRTIKYGSTKDYILRLTVVLPSGEIIKLGTNAVKTSSGYDLCRLFVGSEGTLGVITEITLRLVGIPHEYMAAIAQFQEIRHATDSVFQIMKSGLSPAALEFLDVPTIKAINKYKKLTLTENPTLFIEFHGTTSSGLKEELEIVREICSENKVDIFDSGIGRQERNRLWEARYEVHESIKTNHPGLRALVIDTAVPISKYPEMVEFGHRVIRDLGLKGYAFGHAGSGNLHMEILGNPEDLSNWKQVKEAEDMIVNFALNLGGTSTGEHGIGIGKRKFMKKEHGESLTLMQQIKRLIDPNGIMNPGKIFD